MDNISEEAFEQYREIQREGYTNMLAKQNVKDIAEQFGFSELVEVIEEGNYEEILENYEELVEKYEKE